jgi:hypothetical protein
MTASYKDEYPRFVYKISSEASASTAKEEAKGRQQQPSLVGDNGAIERSAGGGMMVQRQVSDLL